MYGAHDNAGRRVTAGVATAAIHALVIGGLAWGLSFTDAEPARDAAATLAIDLSEPPPPPPPPPETAAADAAKDAPAPEGLKGEAMPREAPRPALPFPMPPAAPTAGDGGDSSDGAGAQGSGAGAGGSGTGNAGGGGGTGSAAVRIAGALRDSDYPRGAEREGMAGTVAISFRVRPDGAVDRCRVVRSSGFATLDELTCRLFIQRFRFRPATDARGQPVESTLQTSFTWGTRMR